MPPPAGLPTPPQTPATPLEPECVTPTTPASLPASSLGYFAIAAGSAGAGPSLSAAQPESSAAGEAATYPLPLPISLSTLSTAPRVPVPVPMPVSIPPYSVPPETSSAPVFTSPFTSASASAAPPTSAPASAPTASPTTIPAPAYVPAASPFPGFAFGATTPHTRPRRGDPGTRCRQLSDNELSYYLPSRSDGVNDMYVHHGLRAPIHLLSHARVQLAWALQLVRHPLLAATVSMRGYDDVAFVHAPPRSVDAALAAADARMQYFDGGDGADGSADGGFMDMDLVDAYLNGPRTLGNDMLACLVVRRGTQRTAGQSGAAGPAPEEDEHLEAQATATTLPQSTVGEPTTAFFEVMLCTTHYISDGMAVHMFMDELYRMLGSGQDEAALLEALERAVYGSASELPPALEDRLGLSALQSAVGDVGQRRADARLLGGQSLPVRKGRARHTAVPTHAFTAEQTARALAKCKHHNVSIAHVVFALCAVAWNKHCADRTQPTMFYSALNMRPHIPPSSSFFHLAVGHFHVVLPSLAPPIPVSDLVWHRAHQAKSQILAATKSPLLKATFRASAAARAARAQARAAVDDAHTRKSQAHNPGLGLGITLPEREAPKPDPEVYKPMRAPPPPPAGKALMGISMLGDLDSVYQQGYGGIDLFGLTTGLRQRAGGLLLFAYTFADKLWLSLGYDANGVEDGAIERFWADVLSLAGEVLLS